VKNPITLFAASTVYDAVVTNQYFKVKSAPENFYTSYQFPPSSSTKLQNLKSNLTPLPVYYKKIY